MKKCLFLFSFFLIWASFFNEVLAQCAMCTKTAQQLGEKPALGLNTGILYLMMAPFAIVGFIGYRWWKSNKKLEEEEQSNKA